jgi:hypothetical protein
LPSRYEDIWHEHVSEARFDEIHSRSGYSERETIQAHLSIFNDYMDEEASRREKYDLWDSYVENMVAGGGSFENWFNEVGIFAADFDWEAWRGAMGY